MVIGTPGRLSVPLAEAFGHESKWTIRRTRGDAEAITALAADRAVDAIYVTSDREDLTRDVDAAAQGGKHVLLEITSLLDPQSVDEMQLCCSRANVLMLAAHAHSYDPIYLQSRALLDTGDYGAVQLIVGLSYLGVRSHQTPSRIDAEQLYLQADLTRLLGGAAVSHVRLCRVGNAQDDKLCRHAAIFWLHGGGVASMTYGGQGRFNSDEWCGSTDRDGLSRPAPFELLAFPRRSRHIGPIVLSCDAADLRPLPDAVYVYRDGSCRVIPTDSGPSSTLAAMADDLSGYVSSGRRPRFDAAWFRDTLRLCAALRQSLATDSEVALRSDWAPRT